MADGWSAKRSSVRTKHLSLVDEPARLQQRAPAAPRPEADLMSTIEDQVIPRLVMAHRSEVLITEACADARPPPTHQEVAQLSRLAVAQDLAQSMALVEAMCRDGLSIESVLMDLISPAARLLGQEWADDDRPFTEVTAGLGTLQQLVNVLGPTFAPGAPSRGLVLLTGAPGEQHTLGLYLVSEFLRRAGFAVQVTPLLDEVELLDAVASQRVEVVGFSVSNTHLLKPLARLITQVRKASRNKRLGILLGGSLALHEFAMRHSVSLCTDAREAVRLAEQHLVLTDSLH